MFLVANGTKMMFLGDINSKSLYNANHHKRKNFNGSLWSVHSNWVVGSSKKEEVMRKFNHFRYDKIKDKCK